MQNFTGHGVPSNEPMSMRRPQYRSFVAVTAFFAVLTYGCASTNSQQPEPLAEESALIKGVSSSAIAGVLLPIGTHAFVNIRKLDGKDVASKIGNVSMSYPTEARVAPGEHILEVRCYGNADGIKFSNTLTLVVRAERGRTYQLVPGPVPWGCDVSIVEAGSS